MSEWTEFVASKDVRRRTLREMWDELSWGWVEGSVQADYCSQYKALSSEEKELFERELIRRVTLENSLMENAVKAMEGYSGNREATRFTVRGNPKVVRVNAGQAVEWVNELGEVVMDTPTSADIGPVGTVFTVPSGVNTLFVRRGTKIRWTNEKGEVVGYITNSGVAIMND